MIAQDNTLCKQHHNKTKSPNGAAHHSIVQRTMTETATANQSSEGAKHHFVGQGPTAAFKSKTATMPQSLVKVATHITFSTKHRKPFIDPGIGDSLSAYLGSVCHETDSIPVKIGGHTDHVHILCLLSRKVALMNVLEETKKRSSKWIEGEGERYQIFIGRRGTGLFR